MKNIVITCTVLILCLISCNKEDTLLNKGSITVSSRKYFNGTYYVKGYSFEKSGFVDIFLNTTEADIVPGDSLNLSGGSEGILLSVLSNNPNGFYLNARHNNLPDANTFFDNYITVNAPSFSPLTYVLKPFDVYTLKTKDNNYVKLLVTNVQEGSDYFDADLKFVIQRDGSQLFSE